MTYKDVAPLAGAWIEMLLFMETANLVVCRPPRGGRGLKSCWCRGYQYLGQVAPLAGGVD